MGGRLRLSTEKQKVKYEHLLISFLGVQALQLPKATNFLGPPGPPESIVPLCGMVLTEWVAVESTHRVLHGERIGLSTRSARRAHRKVG